MLGRNTKISVCVLRVGKLLSRGAVRKRKVKSETGAKEGMKGVPKASDVNETEIDETDGMEAGFSQEPIPEEPDAEESKVNDDGDVEMEDETNFVEEVQEEQAETKETEIKMKEGAVISAAQDFRMAIRNPCIKP